jgi:2-(1,2-epoxy-1,2-dihydrophenyl)acetyl-CoA isomerase
MPDYQFVRVAVSERVGTVTLNRPDRLNAFEAVMVRELAQAVRSVVEDSGVRAIVITGEGRGFCAGADVKYLESCVRERRVDDALALLDNGNSVVQYLHSTPKPVIASLNGPAAGGGASLALAADIRLASPQTSIGFVFHRLGLVPDMGASALLPRLVGPARALELLWSAEMLPVERCFALGLVNRVCPADELAASTTEVARRLAELPPIAVGLAKAAVYRSASEDLAATLAGERAGQRSCFLSADGAEGLAAFHAKRSPHFVGR